MTGRWHPRVVRPVRLLLTLALVLTCLAVTRAPAHAAAFTVDCTPDALIAAITAANRDPDADTIALERACTYTLTAVNNDPAGGATGLPAISSPITIQGNGAIVERSDVEGIPAFRLFVVQQDGNLTLDGLTVRNGLASERVPSGGGLRNLGGTLTVTHSTISGNRADFGGGIYNSGTLTVTNSTLSANTADFGGGIYNRGTITIEQSTLSGNTATWGGGIRNTGGTLTVTHSTLSANRATYYGGSIDNTGTLTIEQSTLSGNTATYGGGIVNGSTLTITNSTLSGNTATQSGGGIFHSSGPATLQNSIVANSLAGGTCDGPGSISDGGGNLSYPDASCPGRNADPLLGPLADNGGPTQTHALLSGSPAIDAGVDCPPPTTDQRGVARPQGAACDSGAVELVPATPTPTATVAPTTTPLPSTSPAVLLTPRMWLPMLFPPERAGAPE